MEIQLFSDGGAGYSFTRSHLEFSEANQENKFKSLKNHQTLSNTICKPKYRQLAAMTRGKYSACLDQLLPEFLSDLKKSGDQFYMAFLNNYGDQRFCKFRMKDKEVGGCKGLYFYLLKSRIMYFGITKDSFYKRINSNGYGNISPKNCYLDGQSTNCHLNSLINDSDRANLSLWICSLKDIRRLDETEKSFIENLYPSWNQALKRRRKSNCLYLTHCSESKHSDFKNSKAATTPDELYASTRIESFIALVRRRELPWAIFSNKYGFVFPSSVVQWYDQPPDALSPEDVANSLKDAIAELREYDKIIYIAGKDPLHDKYVELIDSMRASGLVVEVQAQLE